MPRGGVDSEPDEEELGGRDRTAGAALARARANLGRSCYMNSGTTTFALDEPANSFSGNTALTNSEGNCYTESTGTLHGSCS